MANQLLTDQSYSSGTTTTDLVDLRDNGRPWVTLCWQFEVPSGSGSNTLTVGAITVANWESDTASEVTFTLDYAAHWRGPRVVDDTMITGAAGSKFKTVSDIRRLHEKIKLTFAWAGAGSRVFRVNLWAI